MSPAVCDAGPLIALSMVDQLDLLTALFTRILIPREAHEEVLAGGRASAGLESFRAWNGGEVLNGDHPLDPLLAASLDAGEAAVIAMAISRQIPMVIMDERKGRKIARNVFGLQVCGTARILVEGKRAGMLESVRPVLSQLKSLGYWIDRSIVEEACRMAGEEI